jgi:hypothetical protein
MLCHRPYAALFRNKLKKRCIFTPKTVRSLLKPLKKLQDQNVFVQIRWVPSHVGVQGNTTADHAARLAMKDVMTLPRDTVDIGAHKVYTQQDMRRAGHKRYHEANSEQTATNYPRKKTKLTQPAEKAPEPGHDTSEIQRLSSTWGRRAGCRIHIPF